MKYPDLLQCQSLIPVKVLVADLASLNNSYDVL